MANPPPIRVLTVDRLPLVHAGVRQLLRAFPDLELVGEAYTAGDALRHDTRGERTILLVEIDDLGPEWAGALQRLVGALPRARVVVFTAYATPERVRQALQVGAHGFLLKHVQPLTLAHALRSIASGQQILDPEATQAILSVPREGLHLSEALSRREREMLALLAHGLSNQAIGTRLCVSLATVKFHCRNLFAKLGVETRTQAVAAAYAYDLVPRLVADDEAAATTHPEPECEARLRSA